MRTIRRLGWLGLPVLLVAVAWTLPAGGQEKTPGSAVEMRVVKYAQLGDVIRGLHGKVVLVDFWGTDCVPCKRALPHLNDLQREYGKDGFTAVSVCLITDDEVPVPETRTAALKFLQEKNLAITNLFLDEKTDLWVERLRFGSVPAVYVFNREGKWYQFKDPFNYADVEKLVVKLLQTGPR